MSQNTPPHQPNPYGDPYGQPGPQQPGPPQHPGPPGQQPLPGGPGPYGGPPQSPPEPETPDHGDNKVGFFKALFDVSFTNYATPSIVRIIYVLAMVLGVLSWLVGAVSGVASGRGLIMAVLVLAVGWIPLLLWISILRVGLELVLASVRTAENTRKIRENYGL